MVTFQMFYSLRIIDEFGVKDIVVISQCLDLIVNSNNSIPIFNRSVTTNRSVGIYRDCQCFSPDTTHLSDRNSTDRNGERF